MAAYDQLAGVVISSVLPTVAELCQVTAHFVNPSGSAFVQLIWLGHGTLQNRSACAALSAQSIRIPIQRIAFTTMLFPIAL